MRTYKRAPVDFVRGEGPLLWDAEGKEYLDFLTGISVCSVGHCHPAVVEAVREQAGAADARLQPLLHRADGAAGRAALGVEPRRPRLLRQLRAPRPTSARSRSPASTPTAAASPRRRSSASRATSTAAATAPSRRRPGWPRNEALGPMLPGFRSVPRNDAAALREAVGENTAAVLIEPIQGEAGIYPISDEALLAAREACDEVGALLILDEIQTGIGRTGSLWAYEQTPVRPDVITSAKALGGGFPIGACITAPGGGRRARARRPRLDLRRRPGRHRGGAGGPRHRRRPGAAARACASCGAQLREGLQALDGVARGARPRPDDRRRPRGGDRRGGGRRRPARARPRRQRPRARDAAAAAAADGRAGPDRAGGWPDRRIASRLARS